jgi:hypothetical protein
VNSAATVKRGTLVVKLTLSGDVATKPDTHVAHWIGEHPCHSDGQIISSIQNSSRPQTLDSGVHVDFTFSAKADYRDYHHKVTTYIGRITGEARKVEPSATAQTFPAIPEISEEGVFKYVDTASTRAGIGAINARVAGLRIGIIGTGGTGAYILDFVAKTPVAEIHIFDNDVFSQHNAFRSPGAASLEQLQAKPRKVSYFHEVYSNMHKFVIVHDTFIDASNVSLLDRVDFVFVSMDKGEPKRVVVDRLTANRTPFVEVGMGLFIVGDRLTGIVRTTTSLPEAREKAAPHISYSAEDGEVNEYATNIQIPELNALNAAMAVIQWKTYYGIYRDGRKAHYCGFSVGTSEMVVEGSL